MGLDMYLERYPRYKNYTADNINAYVDYIGWKKEKQSGADVGEFDDWGYYGYEDLPAEEDRLYLDQFYSTKYWAWDKEKRFPHERIYEQVAYWRKANAIHKWFVFNVQDDEDDCQYHGEVTKELLEELRDICKKILEECVLVKGKVKNGYVWKNGKEVPNWEDGLVVANPEICEKLLPTTEGFFFGGTQYNEWYMDDVRYTFETISKVLDETDFEKQMIYYISSW